MKRRISLLLLALVIACQSFSIAAYAAELIGNASTTVTYTKKDESTGETEGSQGPLFEIFIPAEISLNSGRTFSMSASSLNLEPGKSVVVSLDGDRTFDNDGYLHLKASGREDARIAINRHNQELNAGELIGGPGLHPVAVFSGSNLQPEQYGTIYLNLIGQNSVEPGQYQGTLYFVFELQ